jgi:hypothetical protein
MSSPPSIATEIVPRLRRETTDAPHDLEPTPATDVTNLLEEETLRVQAALRHITVGPLAVGERAASPATLVIIALTPVWMLADRVWSSYIL